MPASSVLTALTVRDQAATLAVIAAELGVLVALAGGAYLVARWVLGRLASLKLAPSPEAIRALRLKVRAALMVLSGLLAVAIVAYNGWLIARGGDVPRETSVLLSAVSPEIWIGIALASGKLAAAAIAVALATRVVRRVLGALEAACNRWDRIHDNDRSLSTLFAGVNRALATAGWLLVAWYGLWLAGVPEGIRTASLRVIQVYLVIAMGLLVIRSTTVIVDSLDGLSHRYAHTRGWMRYYDHLRPLVPTFRMCLEYALWVTLAALVVRQLLGPAGNVAAWGPKLLQAIGIFFLGRVAIELGRFEIGRRLLPAEGLDEMTRRRRATMAPLVRSALTYTMYFGTAVLILAALGFNPMPFLAGAGILGLVVGFGAQSLINDVVSGFFILFEHTYLIGDVIEAGGGRGVVEAIEFRTTKIRDSDGRVHIIRNGDVKDVINYSKDYTVAVVPVDIDYDADLRGVFSVLREAAERVRAESADVLADRRHYRVWRDRPDDTDVYARQTGPSRGGCRGAALLDQRSVRPPRRRRVAARTRPNRVGDDDSGRSRPPRDASMKAGERSPQGGCLNRKCHDEPQCVARLRSGADCALGDGGHNRARHGERLGR